MKHKIGMIIACSALVVFVVIAKIGSFHTRFGKALITFFRKRKKPVWKQWKEEIFIPAEIPC